MGDTKRMNAVQTLHQFWSSFGIPAYDESTVPDNASLPYLTYEISNDFFGNALARNVSLWYRSASWSAITFKEQDIAETIGRGGRMLECDEGAIWIKRGVPWAQRMTEPSDDMIRRIVLNIEMEFLI